MIKRFVSIFLLALICCCGLKAEPVERVLSLEESIQAGLHNNQQLLSMQEEISLAQQRIIEVVRRLEEEGEIIISGRGGDNELIM